MYMKVIELNEHQLNILRSEYFYEFDEEGEFDSAEEIPNETLFEHYEGISFVEEDFC